MKTIKRNFHDDETGRSCADRFAAWMETRPELMKTVAGRGVKINAWHKKGKLRGFYVYPIGSSILIARVDMALDQVVFYYWDQPFEKTRLTYLIGSYSLDTRENERMLFTEDSNGYN